MSSHLGCFQKSISVFLVFSPKLLTFSTVTGTLLYSQFICLISIKAMPKRTYQPKKIKRARRHGFTKRMSTATGQEVIKRRRRKGRKKLSA